MLFPIANGTVKLFGGDKVQRTSTVIRDDLDRREEQENLLGELDGTSPPLQDSSPDGGKARNVSGPCQGTTFTVITLNRASNCTEESILPNPTTIHWRDQSNKYDLGCDAWTPHGRLWEYRDEKPPDLKTWSGERLPKKQTTSRPDYLWPETRKGMSEAAQRKEKQKWTIEKPKVLRGIYFIDPADAEFKETFKHARRHLEVQVPAAMPCMIRRTKYKETCRTPDTCKTIVRMHRWSRRIYEKAFGRNSA